MTDFAEGSETASELMPTNHSPMLNSSPRFDAVNRPAHYAAGAIECIDAIREALRGETDPFVAYCRGNVMKYDWRTGKKGNAAEDLRKAAWYATRAAEHIEGGGYEA